LPGSRAGVGAQKGRSVPWWFWAAVMIPVLVAAGGFWFLTRTESGRLLWLDWQYRIPWIHVRLPVSGQPPSSAWGSKEVMSVQIDKDGQYSLGQDLTDLGKIEAQCRAWSAAHIDADGRSLLTVRIIADRRCRASHVVKVIETARRGGAWRFGLLAMSSQPPESGAGRSHVRIDLWYSGRATDVEEVFPAPDWSVQDLVRELDRFESAGVTNYCVGKYKLD